MSSDRKRGLSPVIATVLLVAIALVLAVIIFLWARNFVGEAIQKEGQAIELSCEEVAFISEAYKGKVYIENTGVIPIYGVEIRAERILGDVEIYAGELEQQIAGGETSSVDYIQSEIKVGDNLNIVPILLGINNAGTERKIHVCDEDYGEEIVVGE